MSYTHNTCFVAQIETGAGDTYYFCSSSRVDGFSMDGNAYLPYITDIGEAEKIGNFGEGSSFGKCSMRLFLGQKQYQDAYNLDISLPWNNSNCTIKIRDVDNDTIWAGCEDYYKGIIKNFTIDNNSISFDIEETNTHDNQIVPRYTVEDIVALDSNLTSTDIPKDSVGKRVPMQFGDLNDSASGQFGKGIVISNKIGFQQVHFDTTTIDSLDSIGIWETGTKRYFEGKASGEYTINSTTHKVVEFKADSSALLNEDLTATDGMETINILGYENLVWEDESDYEQIDNFPEILSINIISIDSELMLLIEQPTSNTIRVERGYGGSTVAEHSSGANIYQSSKFSARNCLSFSDYFYPKALSNFFYYGFPATRYGLNIDTSTNWRSLLDSDETNYIRFIMPDDGGQSSTNVDLRFEKIEDDFTVYGVYSDFKVYCDLYTSTIFTPLKRVTAALRMISDGASVNSYCNTANGNETCHLFMVSYNTTYSRVQFSIDTKTIGSGYDREDYTGSYYRIIPNLIRESSYTDMVDQINTDESIQQQALVFQNLSDLNKKWKLNVWQEQSEYPYDSSKTNSIRLYRIGFLIDFFADFTKRRIVGECGGRLISTTVQNILGQVASSGALATKAYEIIAIILTEELGYSSSDFDTTSWQSVNSFFESTEEQLTCAFSYGIDQSEKGWDLCQSIASQFNLMLTKTDSGKIKLIDLAKLQSTNSLTGYPSITAYQISFDDIIISGGKRAISIQQTGTDRIRNIVKINYNKNNSTDEYQNSFPGGEQGYTNTYLDANEIMPESGITLSTARTNYYGGQKTETLEIDAFAIYDWINAYKLWRWHIRDKAEVFFYATLTLPYYHYSDVNSKTAQYDIGDIIYFDGIYQGITFNSTHKWVIRNITKTDNGKEIKIEAKSIEPVSEY